MEIIISQPSPEKEPVYIYIGGQVNNPGFYPAGWDDSIEALISAAGGIVGDPASFELNLLVEPEKGKDLPQKIDINRAEVWLLEALPGIGETRAEAIVEHRQQNGLFRNINELTEVEGIGAATYEKIKGYITVQD
jgi:competence protein ComEA